MTRLLLLPLLVACNGEEPADTDTAEPASCVERVPLEGKVLTYEGRVPVPDATVEIYETDSMEGSADQVLTTDFAGAFTAEIETCRPFTVRVREVEKELVEAVTPHRVVGPGETATVTVDAITPKTTDTIGEDAKDVWESEKALVIGRIWDAFGALRADAVATIEDASGPLSGVEVGYMQGEWPDSSLSSTSADGRFYAFNVPWSQYYARAWVGGELAGTNVFQSFGRAVVFLDVFEGDDDGVVLPAGCTCDEALE